ncbi:molybdopterin molybdotransferase MoeA [Dermabacter sp. HSID17554]|uniref:molybdopterin molybdotransferase MoeA n=1 Tax=Dermabacter sp. HSID17554 TaxID=2419511 RepID=UPI000F878795|nr:molybdopterin molybdotransferase MoeA [Dermabacter sp. HSID17554]RUP85833.1 molybdopterin molybdenumtransferase MoeA [Dermabacter sp. HSID17554]
MHVSLDEWRATVLGLAALAPDRTEEAPLERALGRRLAEPLTARLPAPDFRMSAMDGFAVSTRELGLGEGDSDACPAHLEVTCDISAGRAAVGNRRPGTAARIMTGGLMPDDLDTVIPVEFTDADPTAAEAPARIALTIPEAERAKALTPGRHVRKVGEEIPAGDLLARKGDFVTPQIIGIALSVGVTHARLTRPRKVAIVMTGDELVTDLQAGAGARPGAVLESNGPMLQAACARLGAEASIHHVGDDPAELIALARSIAPRHDLIVTTGGVGSGARDVVKAAFGEGFGDTPGLNCSRFEHLAMRPGGPQGVGRLPVDHAEGGNTTPMVHLPGTPVGAFTAFHLFIAPLLGSPSRPLTLPERNVRREAQPLKTGATVKPAHLAIENGSLIATECEGSRLRPFAEANALLILEKDRVRVLSLAGSLRAR